MHQRALRGTHPAAAAPPDCLGRINRAIDFILANLHRSHTLEDVARAAHVSPFHFHRVFRSIVRETPAQSWMGRPFAHGLEWFELPVQLPVCRP